jgi:hypothetical protein
MLGNYSPVGVCFGCVPYLRAKFNVMKLYRFLLIAFLAISTFTASADAWDDLTMAQAKKVQAYLKKNPWILDYCDCCDPGDTYLMRVVSSEIVTCTWEPSKYSVKVNALRVAKVEVNDSGINEHNAVPMSETVSYTIFMNYTFAYDKAGKWAVPLFKKVAYDRDHVCKGATKFPKPTNTAGNQLSNEYTKWYSKRVAKIAK